MRLAVVIPTRDRPAALARCLEALRAQSRAVAELIVVDDGSVDRAAVARVAAEAGGRLLEGRGRGPAAARNLGSSAASDPEAFAFLDDDCLPRPGWLAALAACLEQGAAVAAGPTICDEGVLGRASQLITTELVERDRLADGSPRFVPSCNLAVTTATARAFPFDESFPTAAGEDRDWCGRLVAADLRIAWSDSAAVVHRPGLDARGFARQQIRYGRGARQLGPAHTVGASPDFQLRLLRRGLAAGPRVGLAVAGAQLLTGVGYLSSTRE